MPMCLFMRSVENGRLHGAVQDDRLGHDPCSTNGHDIDAVDGFRLMS
jgi:hypothetical protein